MALSCEPRADSAPGQATAVPAESPKTANAAGLRDTVGSQDSLAFPSTPPELYAELDRGGKYVDSVFRAYLGESPRLGWLVGGSFLASERHPHVVVYSVDPVLQQVAFRRVMGPGEHAAITRQHHVACEVDGPLAEYGPMSGNHADGARAFFTSRAPAEPIGIGLKFERSTPEDIAAAHGVLGPSQQALVSLDTTLLITPGHSYYSVHAVYDSSTKDLVKSVFILHDADGRIVGSEVTEAAAFECDGCGIPTLDEGLQRLYAVLNGFRFTMFPYPLLLLDTGTVEGRALSLVTFAPSGTYAEYRIYEYVVTCILDGGS